MEKETLSLEELASLYHPIKPQIESRLQDFSRIWKEAG